MITMQVVCPFRKTCKHSCEACTNISVVCNVLGCSPKDFIKSQNKRKRRKKRKIVIMKIERTKWDEMMRYNGNKSYCGSCTYSCNRSYCRDPQFYRYMRGII